VLQHFKEPCLVHHGDTWDLPPDGVLLASTIFPQAFRLGSALGVQFHPEASPTELAAWIARSGNRRYEAIGMSASALHAEAVTKAAAWRAAAAELFEAWWQHLPAAHKA